MALSSPFPTFPRRPFRLPALLLAALLAAAGYAPGVHAQGAPAGKASLPEGHPEVPGAAPHPDGHPDIAGAAKAAAGAAASRTSGAAEAAASGTSGAAEAAASGTSGAADTAASGTSGAAETAGNPHGGLVEGHGGRMPSLLPDAGRDSVEGLSSLKALEGVAVLHEGRIKPMETFSRHMLLQFSGRTSYKSEKALEVMARILFAPGSTGEHRIFLINNPEVVQALGIEPEKRRKYTYLQLEKSLAKLQELAEKADAVESEKRDLVQKEVLRVYSNVIQYLNLTRTLSFALPNPAYTVMLPETKAALGLPSGESMFSFWDLMSRAPAIARVLEAVGERGRDKRSMMEAEVISLSQSMYMSSQTLAASPLKVLPLPGAEQTGWLSPPEAVAVPAQLQAFNDELDALAKAAATWRKGDQAAFDAALAGLKVSVENRAHDQLQTTHFPVEIAYQKGEPFHWALVMYWLSLLGTFGFFLFRRNWLYRASLAVFTAGLAVHVAGIVARIIVMQRPPVTSLYETFPFVAAVALLSALFMERVNARRKSPGMALLCASLLGVILLHIAARYAAEGDTMRMLVAVLDSNFWLSTHVITITIGYSACLLSGAIGHVWMVRALLPGDGKKAHRLKEMGKMIYGTLCFGLLFSFIGTVLGGIWADQSWGRFWGWDPKENGALLIVIWCVILLHAKQWGYVRDHGMAQGSIFGAVIVALAWFGVNLLNVGLHSYGFTDGAATKLMAYCAGELAFMTVTGAWLKLARKPGSVSTPTPSPAAAAEPG
jgi:ABC-type transport system involved in cytochrome c biogenesis permease subunit